MTLLLCLPSHAFALDGGIALKEVPAMPEGTVLFEHEAKFARRGKVGGYAMKPSKYGVYSDRQTRREGASSEPVYIRYRKVPGPSFCGAYLILMGDLSRYATLAFWIKGARGGETFEIGLNDVISNKREDAVIVGSIVRYLPQGVTQEWQQVKIPLEDFFGADLARVYSIVFNFNEEGEGIFWVDGFEFHEEALIHRDDELISKSSFLLDNFDHSDVNLLGRKANAYKRLPSVCEFARVISKPVSGTETVPDTNRALRLVYDKKATGWCGYYSLLNQIDGAYFDLAGYKQVSFWVRGEKGGETFEIGMADRSWLTIGDSVKAGTVEKYLPARQVGLPEGVTREWQEIAIPLSDFGKLDWSQMGSFTINFHQAGRGVLYVDNLRFIRKSDEDLLKEWEE